ncbi:MAG: AraC family transcriptional regulator [Bacteroidetes bacterium]|nr:AraC family transcriptional regulator [Bacteroidota bacterium]
MFIVSNFFCRHTGITIEKYINLQLIEKVKELLIYDKLTLSEIANQTGYSSVQHLSNQFKKIMGIILTMFKKFR